MRNVLTIPISGTKDTLIIASDNSGAIGKKKDDLVFATYDTVAYYSFRVAVMECIAAGGEPISVVLNNFCGNEAWEDLTRGINRGLAELQLKKIAITGSTESNFSLQQSAIGMMVLGKKPAEKKVETMKNENMKIAIIGRPLVGQEVVVQAEKIAPLSMFQKVCSLPEVTVWPVGSKGILSELNHILGNKKLLTEKIITDIDVLKSSGPATCFLVLYKEDMEEKIKKLTGSHYHSLQILS